jgi:hypothetical protein
VRRHKAARFEDARQFCDRVSGKAVGVLLAGKALFLVVADQANAMRPCHFNKGDPAIVQAGGGNTRKVNRFPTIELLADRGKALFRKISVGAMNMLAAKISAQRPLNDTTGERAQARIARSSARNAESPEFNPGDNLGIAPLKVR